VRFLRRNSAFEHLQFGEFFFNKFQEQFDLMALFVRFVFELFGLNKVPLLNLLGDFGVPVETAATEVVSDFSCRRKSVVPIHKKNDELFYFFLGDNCSHD
jgi:hypothetical protein